MCASRAQMMGAHLLQQSWLESAQVAVWGLGLLPSLGGAGGQLVGREGCH
jgi:hypothetical protein